jgi:photosystem II stability/assembly factor-like uncharacterized protein
MVSHVASSITSTFLFATLLLAGVGTGATGQDITWRPAISGTRSSFRGLSVASDGSIWIGGTQGTVIRSTDKGTTWSVDTVPGARSFDFRGVAAIDSLTVYVAVSSADTGRIYKTADGGLTWRLQYRDERKGVFFDGVACWSAQRCLVAGDPIAGRFVIIATDDGGAHWVPRDTATGPAARPNEAAFAASNSTLIVGSGGRAWLATGGGPSARVWRTSDYGLTWRVSETPIIAGKASAGIFSLAFCDVLHGIAVGGDYRAPDSTGAHVAHTADGGETWVLVDSSHVTPYLSGTACVLPAHGPPTFVSVGPAGSFRSVGGWRWERAAREALNAVASLPNGQLVAAGGNGTVVTAEQRAVTGTR